MKPAGKMARLILCSLVFCIAGAVIILIIGFVLKQNAPDDSNTFAFITREGWGARAATSKSQLVTPAPDVVIHHTATAACTNRTACIKSMRSMQNYHQNTNGWADIGYNFVVGGDGAVYESRGWMNLGAHARGWNSRSVGIAMIGNYESSIPPANMLQITRSLIVKGVELGYISKTYRLLGHRQVTSTVCPGDGLYNEIRTWDRFTATP